MGGRSQGKKNNPRNFAHNRDPARKAGSKGGLSKGKAVNPGNFANNRERACCEDKGHTSMSRR